MYTQISSPCLGSLHVSPHVGKNGACTPKRHYRTICRANPTTATSHPSSGSCFSPLHANCPPCGYHLLRKQLRDLVHACVGLNFLPVRNSYSAIFRLRTDAGMCLLLP